MTETFPKAEIIHNGEINMAVHQMGAGPPVILVHGFPELAYSWRHQIPALAAAGYRAIAPDMRGYGGTDKPVGVGAYTIQKLIADLTGLMDALSIERALLVGHDWGALIVWQMALLAPERMSGIINLNIPFMARPPINPVTLMRWKFGKDFYIVNFQDSDQADKQFDENPARFIDFIMRKRKRPRRQAEKGRNPKRRAFSLLEMLAADNPTGAPILNAEELQVFAHAFAAGGFTAPINWYRNFKHNWKTTRGVDQTIRLPTLFVGATEEIFASPKQIEAMKKHIAELETTIIEDCGHWTQQEKPKELNRVMLSWMARHYPA